MESPQTTISCGRFFQHPYSDSVGFRRVSAHVPSYGSIGDQQSVPKPNLTGKLLILNRMKAMAIAGPFQNLSNHFKTPDVLSGAKRTRARSSAVSRQVRAGKRRVRTGRAFEMSWNQSGGDPSANVRFARGWYDDSRHSHHRGRNVLFSASPQ